MTERAGNHAGRPEDPLRRGVGLALWRQVADGLRAGIAAGLADDAGRLPSEAVLAARFGVNRHTLRAALAALAQEGVVDTAQGRGTFVRTPLRLRYPIGLRTRFSAGLEGQARDRQIVVLRHEREPATAAVAAALRLAAGADVVRVETLGWADGIPVSRATAHFGAARFGGRGCAGPDCGGPDGGGIAERIIATGSVTRALAGMGVTDYRRASTVIGARHADAGEAEDLRLAPGAIVLVTTALDTDPDGAPIGLSLTRFPADRVDLTVAGPEGEPD